MNTVRLKWVARIAIPLLLSVALWAVSQEKIRRVSTIALVQEMSEQRPNYDRVELLVRKGADVNKRARFDDTPLRLAVGKGVPLVKLFLENGADVDAQNKSGLTALMRAAEYGSVTYVRLLLDAGAQVNIRDRKGHTALGRARRMREIKDGADVTNYLEVEQILKESGGII